MAGFQVWDEKHGKILKGDQIPTMLYLTPAGEIHEINPVISWKDGLNLSINIVEKDVSDRYKPLFCIGCG